jgi:hypothetical protein
VNRVGQGKVRMIVNSTTAKVKKFSWDTVATTCRFVEVWPRIKSNSLPALTIATRE